MKHKILLSTFFFLFTLLSISSKIYCQNTYKETSQKVLNTYYTQLNAFIVSATKDFRKQASIELEALFIDNADVITVYTDLNLLESNYIAKQTTFSEYLRRLRFFADNRGANVFKIEYKIVQNSYTETNKYVRFYGKNMVVSTIDVEKTIIYGSRTLYILDHITLYDGLIEKVESSSRRQNSNDKIRVPTSKRVEIYATYEGRRTNANLYIDPLSVNPSEAAGYQSAFSVELSYGEYKVRMSGNGTTATRTIVVSANGPNSFEVKLKSESKIVPPWKKEFNSKVVGLSIGYVQRCISLKHADNNVESVSLGWWENNKTTPGIRVGLHFQPCFNWGLGIYFGGFFEYYYSPTPSSKKATTENASFEETFTSFSEKVVSVPLHLYYRVPLGSEFAVSLHGGLDVEYLFGATYKDKDGVFMTHIPSYGTETQYKHLNIGYSVGVGIQYGHFMVESIWNWGLTNHQMLQSYDSSAKTTLPRTNLGISLLF